MQCLRSGFLPFEESTVHIRVKSTINGITSDPIFSAAIDRAATTFQSSECGSFCTIGIIGDATQGGWDKDTDMRLADATKVDKETWTTTVYLVGGKKGEIQSVRFLGYQLGGYCISEWNRNGWRSGYSRANDRIL